MQTRKIGTLDATVIGIGCNSFGRDLDQTQVATIVNAALDEGINYFDTAKAYGPPDSKSERFLGAALAERRDQAVIATKFGNRNDEGFEGATPAYVKASADESLKRLGTDRIDLFQLHHPDPQTPIEDTLGALAELVQEGKILEFGCTNFSSAELEDAAAAVTPSRRGFASTQNSYSLLDRSVELDILPLCEKAGLGLVTSRPLHFGMLGGRYTRGEAPPVGTRLSTDWYARDRDEILSDQHFDIVEALTAFAQSRGHSIAELSFAWLLSHSAVATVIGGVSSAAQVAANAKAATWILSEEELEQIDSIAPRLP